MSTTSESVSQPSITSQQNISPSEVGWQFVPQYYTIVNKSPHRLHCFYTKNSTFIHGTEGEDGRPCFGQQEIHQKIMQLAFEGCKVYIHSVDAQSSTNGGIIIQVIGEMSNRNEAWRKFVQTFFLAPQPNGYFVLNDIFRFLKEESVVFEGEELEELQAEEVATSAPIELAQEPEPEPAPVNIPSPVSVHAPVEPVAEALPEPAPEPAPPVEEVPKSQPNGVHHEPEPEPEVPAVEEPTEEEPAPVAEEPTPAPAAAKPAHSPKPAQAPVVQPTPVPAQLAQPAAPMAPKTWANLAKANSGKWGTAVAQESRGVSIEATAPSPPPQPPRSNTQTPSSGAGPRGGFHSGQKGGGKDHPLAYQQANALTTPSVFVKGLVDPLTNERFKEALMKHGGPIKEIEYVRSRACAFVDFEEIESAKKAMIASLPYNQGGGGGIFVDGLGTERPLRIVVEVKKERGDRPPPRNQRGAAPNQSYDRGGYRGAGRGRGRGISSGKAM